MNSSWRRRNPATASLAERTRKTEERPWGVLHESIDVGRLVMTEELESLMFRLMVAEREIECEEAGEKKGGVVKTREGTIRCAKTKK